MSPRLKSYTMHQERYDFSCMEEDDDDDDFDDDDVDGYDGLSDYDDEIPQSRDYSRQGAVGAGDDRPLVGSNDPRRQRSVSEGSTGLIEAGEDNRRDHHNQLERKRRASIKTSYTDLREAIPSLRNSKASRAVILQRAVEYIEELVKLNRDHTHCVETLKRQNDLLDSRVQELQRLVQRMDGEETFIGTASCGSISCSGSGTCSAFRLTSASCSANNGCTNSNGNIPVYRILPQDVPSSATDRALAAAPIGCPVSSAPVHISTNQPTNARSSSFGAGHSQSYPTRSLASPVLHFTAMSSASHLLGFGGSNSAANLTASANSAFSSSVSSSGGSSGGPAHSLSQRSSPSETSPSSTASPSNQVSNRICADDDNYATNIPMHVACSESLSAGSAPTEGGALQSRTSIGSVDTMTSLSPNFQFSVNQPTKTSSAPAADLTNAALGSNESKTPKQMVRSWERPKRRKLN